MPSPCIYGEVYKTSVMDILRGLHFRRQFSMVLIRDMRIRRIRKYRIDAVWPRMI